MAVGQKLLIQASEFYNDSLNSEYVSGFRLRPIAKKRAFINHAPDDFRFVEGLIVLMRKSGLDLYFDWDSGDKPGSSRDERKKQVQERIANCDVFFVIATENYLSVPYCLQDLEIAKSLNKKIYVIPTAIDGTVYGTEYIGIYHELTVQKTVQGRFVVKSLDTDRKNLWRTINSIDLL
jgi:hypothetical protein